MAKFLKIVFGGIFGDRKIAVAEADVKMPLFSSNNFLKLLRNLDCFLTPDYFSWICDAILAKNFSFWLDLTKIRRWRNIFRQNGRKAKFDDNFSSQLGGFFIRVGRHLQNFSYFLQSEQILRFELVKIYQTIIFFSGSWWFLHPGWAPLAEFFVFSAERPDLTGNLSSYSKAI